MLNANARSKAKLPSCAMWEIPNVFFQKPRVQATTSRNGADLEGSRSARARCRDLKEILNETEGPLRHAFSPLGGRGSAARRRQGTDATRSAGGSVDESRARQPTSLRIRGPAQIHDVQRASRRSGGFRPPH